MSLGWAVALWLIWAIGYTDWLRLADGRARTGPGVMSMRVNRTPAEAVGVVVSLQVGRIYAVTAGATVPLRPPQSPTLAVGNNGLLVSILRSTKFTCNLTRPK